MPLTWALSLTVTKEMVIFPVLSAVAVNCSTTALYSAPAVARMSKLVSTWLPLMMTLKVREPALDGLISRMLNHGMKKDVN